MQSISGMRFPTPNLHDEDYAGMRVALCQIETERGDLDGNFSRALLALETAREKGADLAVTPECVIHGYAEANSTDDQARLREVAEPIARDVPYRGDCAAREVVGVFTEHPEVCVEERELTR